MKITSKTCEKSILLELAQNCGISLKTVARIEMGCDTKLSKLIKILKAYGNQGN